MKKLYFLFLCVLVLVLLFSCNEELVIKEDVSIVIDDTLPEGNGKVKVVVLSGQSNASGVSYNRYLEGDPKYEEYQTGYSNVLINYMTENTHASNGFLPVTLGQGCISSCFGPELGMAEILSTAYPEETIFLLKYSYGGADLYHNFNPNTPGPLYSTLVEFLDKSLFYLEEKGYQPEIIGFCWMQGESDAVLGNAKHYEGLEKALIRSFRSEYQDYLASTFRFVDAGISEVWSHYKELNAAKRSIAEEDPSVCFLDTIALGLTTRKEPVESPDTAHYDSQSMLTLGREFAKALVE